MNDSLVTITDAAFILSVHPNTIRRMIADGSLPSVVVGGRRSNGKASRRMVATSAINAYIKAHAEGRNDHASEGS